MTQGSANNEIIARIQQREQNQLRLIALSSRLSTISTRAEFDAVTGSLLKNEIGFSYFAICIEDSSEKKYKQFYHNNPLAFVKYKTETYPDNSGIFEAIHNSPEPVTLTKNDYSKVSGLPTFLTDAWQESAVSFIACSLPSGLFKIMLFLGFSRNTVPDRNGIRFIGMLAPQLGITLTNIMLREQVIPATAIAQDKIQADTAIGISEDMGIVGQSEAIRTMRNLIKVVADSDSGVLILGESGTGKELAAKAIHGLSDRKDKPLIKINCAAIPKNLLESELFGHEKGSFTGAIAQKKGKFEQAHKGTLFLDEIGEMPLDLQVKLLRALQEKEIQRIGGERQIKTDARIIAATNRDLGEEVKKGNFRADLYYRLNIFPIEVPSLRERTEDIPELASFFVNRYCQRNRKPLKNIAATALKSLKIYPWPGNVRELEHAIERAILLSPDKTIKEIPLNNNNHITSSGNTIKPWHEFEREYILSVLKFCKGKISGINGAAALLEMPPTTLNSKMERLGIKKRHYLND